MVLRYCISKSENTSIDRFLFNSLKDNQEIEVKIVILVAVVLVLNRVNSPIGKGIDTKGSILEERRVGKA